MTVKEYMKMAKQIEKVVMSMVPKTEEPVKAATPDKELKQNDINIINYSERSLRGDSRLDD